VRWAAACLILVVVSRPAFAEPLRYTARGTATAVKSENVFHHALVLLNVLVDTDTAPESVGPDFARHLFAGPARLIFQHLDAPPLCFAVSVPVECYVYNDATDGGFDALILSVVDFRLPGSAVDLCTFAGSDLSHSMWEDVAIPTVVQTSDFTHTEGFLTAILDGYDSTPLYQVTSLTFDVRNNVPGDVEGDGDVTHEDLVRFSDALTTGDLRADFNFDCKVDLRDFAVLQNHVTGAAE